MAATRKVGSPCDSFLSTLYHRLGFKGHMLPHQHPVRSMGDCYSATGKDPKWPSFCRPDSGYPHDRYQATPMSLDFQHAGRFTKYLLPAAFRSGNCLVLANSATHKKAPREGDTVSPRPLLKSAASAMYFTVWPNVRRIAHEVIENCSVTSKAAGTIVTDSILEGWHFTYWITVMRAEKTIPHDNGIQGLGGPLGWGHHVYDTVLAPAHPGLLPPVAGDRRPR